MAPPNRQPGQDKDKPAQTYYTQQTQNSDALPSNIRAFTPSRVASATHHNKSAAGGFFASLTSVGALLGWLKATCTLLFLPDGYPDSVAPGYLRYLVLNNFAVSLMNLQTRPVCLFYKSFLFQFYFSKVEEAITDYPSSRALASGIE